MEGMVAMPSWSVIHPIIPCSISSSIVPSIVIPEAMGRARIVVEATARIASYLYL
jgi:hypothetical protein